MPLARSRTGSAKRAGKTTTGDGGGGFVATLSRFWQVRYSLRDCFTAHRTLQHLSSLFTEYLVVVVRSIFRGWWLFSLVICIAIVCRRLYWLRAAGHGVYTGWCSPFPLGSPTPLGSLCWWGILHWHLDLWVRWKTDAFARGAFSSNVLLR